MRKFLLGAALAAATFATPALATPTVELDTLIPGSEVRRSISFGDEMRADVIKLNPNGTVTGNFEITRSGLKYGGVEHRQGQIVGTWTVERGSLCIQGRGLEYAHKSCYRITKKHGSRHEYAATDTRTGDIWQMFIYSSNVL